MPPRVPSPLPSILGRGPGLALGVGLLVIGVAGCSRGGTPDDPGSPRRDGGIEDMALSSGDALFAPPDALVDAAAADLLVADLLVVDLAGPTAAMCYEGWRMYGGSCPAPIITSAWAATTGCVGANPGLFIEGMNFQLEKRNTGIADYGPQAQEGFDQKHWNELTTTRLCVTMSSSYALSFPGKRLSVKNPDGKVSNSVTIDRR